MKKYLIGLLLLYGFSNCFAQKFYETKWTSGKTIYKAFIVNNGSFDAFVRVNYTLDNTEYIVEFGTEIQNVENDKISLTSFKGFNPKYIKGSGTYNPDNFVIVNKSKENPELANKLPYTYDVSPEDKTKIRNETQVTYWKELTWSDLNSTFLSQFFLPTERIYHNLLNREYDESFEARNLLFVMSKPNQSVSSDTYNFGPEIEKNWIKRKWNENLHITDVTYANGYWYLTMAKFNNQKFSQQSWKLSETYPDEWITDKMDNNYYITSLSYSGQNWFVVMTRVNNYTNQSVKQSETFPEDWINTKSKYGFYLTEVLYAEDKWWAVMTRIEDEITDQNFKRSTYFPKNWIREQWNDKFYITSAAYGNGEWVIVTSKGNSYSRQAWKLSTVFPLKWMEQKQKQGLIMSTLSNKNE
ncbi:hypothetical protein MWU59_11245 [Flavobacteriaceae bacterium F08102]|nr:hypothetical protein [Flavobacteriaceae bacterium F08102]